LICPPSFPLLNSTVRSGDRAILDATTLHPKGDASGLVGRTRGQDTFLRILPGCKRRTSGEFRATRSRRELSAAGFISI